MFPLMKLPDELILHVIDYVHPSDIESLALCSQTVMAFAKDALLRHSRLKEKYGMISFGYELDDDDDPNEDDVFCSHDQRPLELLLEMSQNNRLILTPQT